MAKSSRSKMLLSNLLPILLFAIANPCLGQRQQWDTANYPNPTAGDWQRCNMRSRSLLCDPDAVLSEQERYRVNYELGQLESSTRQVREGNWGKNWKPNSASKYYFCKIPISVRPIFLSVSVISYHITAKWIWTLHNIGHPKDDK